MNETNHRMTRRLRDWDYSQRAIYMLTLALADRSRDWLGRLDESGRIIPTQFGNAALDALSQMPRLFPQVEILERQIMPEHLHFVVFVKSRLPKPLGALVRGFKAGAAARWKALANNGQAQDCSVPAHSCAGGPVPAYSCAGGSVPAHSCVGGSVPAHFCAGLPMPRWADGFQDTVLLHEGQLSAMLAYVRDNPRRLAEKRANPSLFRRVAMIALPLDNGRITGHFEALGNRHLLALPIHQVQCSRRYFAYERIPKRGGGMKIARDGAGEPVVKATSPDYAERLADALAAAAHGAVVLSPCISDGERQIAREALKRGFRLVALKNMGFSSFEKPSGAYFDACAHGRLLLLAPAAWPYSTQAKAMTRLDATALNRIAQWLAGDGAAAVDYHGMTPLHIDEIASAAVRAQTGKTK